MDLLPLRVALRLKRGAQVEEFGIHHSCARGREPRLLLMMRNADRREANRHCDPIQIRPGQA